MKQISKRCGKVLKPTKQRVKLSIYDGSPKVLKINKRIVKPDKFDDDIDRAGLMHTKKKIVEIMFKVMIDTIPDYGGDVGWGTYRSREYLKKAKNLHKTLDALQTFGDATTKEMLAFLAEKTHSQPLHTNSKTFLQALNQYSQYHPEFSFHYTLYRMCCIALMFHTGTRIGGEKGINMIYSST